MAADSAGIKRGKCPICGRPTETAFRPFCSKRCADIDLSRWLSGAYVIPDDESEDGGEGPVNGDRAPNGTEKN